MKTALNPAHPASRFSTGNLVSLRDEPMKLGIDVRQELLKLHKTYYSANIMKLAVLGRGMQLLFINMTIFEKSLRKQVVVEFH
jgi:secreted Zn-dependent insulinase-like peptidase